MNAIEKFRRSRRNNITTYLFGGWFKKLFGLEEHKAPQLTIAYPKEDIIRDVDFSGIQTTDNRPYLPERINHIYKVLKLNGFTPILISAVLANVVEESGGNPLSKSKDKQEYQGILLWDPTNRYKIESQDSEKELKDQLLYFMDTYRNYRDKVSWTHGGDESGYLSYKDAVKSFYDLDLYNALHGFTFGYVRPSGKNLSVNNRYKVAKQIYERIK